MPDGGAGRRSRARSTTARPTPQGRRCTRAACRTAPSSGGRSSSFRPRHGGERADTRSLDYFGLSQPYLRYQLIRPGQLGPDPFQWQFTDPGFNSMFPAANTFDAMDTNLTAFRRHGGKLIIWQGWADNGDPAVWHRRLLRHADPAHGRPGVDGEVRAPVPVPDASTTAAAATPTPPRLDLVYPMVQWVEQGTAPSELDDQLHDHRLDPFTPAGVSVSGDPEVQRQRRNPNCGDELPSGGVAGRRITPTGSATTCSTSRSAADGRGDQGYTRRR